MGKLWTCQAGAGCWMWYTWHLFLWLCWWIGVGGFKVDPDYQPPSHTVASGPTVQVGRQLWYRLICFLVYCIGWAIESIEHGEDLFYRTHKNGRIRHSKYEVSEGAMKLRCLYFNGANHPNSRSWSCCPRRPQSTLWRPPSPPTGSCAACDFGPSQWENVKSKSPWRQRSEPKVKRGLWHNPLGSHLFRCVSFLNSFVTGPHGVPQSGLTVKRQLPS